jgi:hypothetical protein
VSNGVPEGRKPEQEFAVQFTVCTHADVVCPVLAVHVAVPLPEYPLLQVTKTVCPVVPAVLPLWSVLATVNGPQDEAAHVTVLHADVFCPLLPVHVAVPVPEYPSLQVTA